MRTNILEVIRGFDAYRNLIFNTMMLFRHLCEIETRKCSFQAANSHTHFEKGRHSFSSDFAFEPTRVPSLFHLALLLCFRLRIYLWAMCLSTYSVRGLNRMMRFVGKWLGGGPISVLLSSHRLEIFKFRQLFSITMALQRR